MTFRSNKMFVTETVKNVPNSESDLETKGRFKVVFPQIIINFFNKRWKVE